MLWSSQQMPMSCSRGFPKPVRKQRSAVQTGILSYSSAWALACCDALSKDSQAPAVFPYGVFGSILVVGERSRTGDAFFTIRILAFLPEQRHRHFRTPLRRCEFYSDRALYRDLSRKLEVWLDPGGLALVWDATWNQWKHLLGAVFVRSGK
jgi:hypothetical protein